MSPSRLIAITLVGGVLLSCLDAVLADPGCGVTIEVRAGDSDRERTPVSFPLTDVIIDGDAGSYSLIRSDSGEPVPVQCLKGNPPRLVWMLDEPLPAGTTRRYVLSGSPSSSAELERVTCRADGGAIRVFVDQKPVLTYHTDVVRPPEGIEDIYRRSGFIHPLRTPSGRILTADFPADHPHQHGVFFAWVNTTFEGRKVDFWNQRGGTGTVEHVRTEQIMSGPVFAEFVVTLRHQDLSAPEGAKTALNEQWTVRVYDRDDVFLIDLESRQTCAADSPLVLKEYHYGGMAFRGASAWLNQPEADFLTSEGKSRADGNHTRPHWVDCYGLIAGEPGGVTLMQHPSNFRYPQPVRLHPQKPYFVFSPEVLGEFRIEPGEEYVSRFRLLVHDGPPDERIGDAWRDYAEPPAVGVVE